MCRKLRYTLAALPTSVYPTLLPFLVLALPLCLPIRQKTKSII